MKAADYKKLKIDLFAKTKDIRQRAEDTRHCYTVRLSISKAKEPERYLVAMPCLNAVVHHV